MGEGIANGCTLAETQAAVDRAMNTWDSVNCATIPLVKLPDYGIDWGYVQYLVGYGGVPGWYADVTQAGWLPQEFFDLLFGPDNSVLGVTFTFVWTDPDTGLSTDMDNNGKEDVAFREVYYNNGYLWGIDNPTSYPIDVESIVLHENGHSLSLGHFGKLFRTGLNSELINWSPARIPIHCRIHNRNCPGPMSVDSAVYGDPGRTINALNTDFMTTNIKLIK